MFNKNFRVTVFGGAPILNTVKNFDTFEEALSEYSAMKLNGSYDYLSLSCNLTLLEVTKNGNDNE